MATWPEFHPIALLSRLAAEQVDFVVIGGLAVVTHGHIRTTKDLDITYDSSPGNLKVLAQALGTLEVRLRGVEDDVPFVADARTLRTTQILTLESSEGWIDLLAEPAGSPGYKILKRRSLAVEFDDISFRVASIGDLIAMKTAAGRLQDLADVEALEEIRSEQRRRPRS